MSDFEHQAKERSRILVELQSLAEGVHPNVAHSLAEGLIRQYLRLIGADDIADAWEAADTEYA